MDSQFMFFSSSLGNRLQPNKSIKVVWLFLVPGVARRVFVFCVFDSLPTADEYRDSRV